MTHPPIDRVMTSAQRAARLLGVHLAIVVDNKPGDGGPGYAVKVRFPWLAEQETSSWARIAVPMAGNARGSYVLPEIDDQVLVVFEHGDVDRPIVIGSLWNKQQPPVEANESANNHTKLIKSRSGHRVIFDDKDGSERIVIVDKTRQNKIVLDAANQCIKIECAGDIEVKASNNVIMQAKAVKVGTAESITAHAVEALSHAAAAFSLKAGAQIDIKGANVAINVTNTPATSVSGSRSGFLEGVGAQPAKAQVTETGGAGGG
ncbi:MAG: phage baseplate assembly protein V [Kofleriaceae bacterium]